MIVVNYFKFSEDKDNPYKGYYLDLIAIVNDVFSLKEDVNRVIKCIDNDEVFLPEINTSYELHLYRSLTNDFSNKKDIEYEFVIKKASKLEYENHVLQNKLTRT